MWLVHPPLLAAVNKQMPLGQGFQAAEAVSLPKEQRLGLPPLLRVPLALFGKGTSALADKTEGAKLDLPASTSGNGSAGSFDSLKAQAQAAIEKEAQKKAARAARFNMDKNPPKTDQEEGEE